MKPRTKGAQRCRPMSVSVTPDQLAKLRATAEHYGVSCSELVQDYINSLVDRREAEAEDRAHGER